MTVEFYVVSTWPDDDLLQRLTFSFDQALDWWQERPDCPDHVQRFQRATITAATTRDLAILAAFLVSPHAGDHHTQHHATGQLVDVQTD